MLRRHNSKVSKGVIYGGTLSDSGYASNTSFFDCAHPKDYRVNAVPRTDDARQHMRKDTSVISIFQGHFISRDNVTVVNHSGSQSYDRNAPCPSYRPPKTSKRGRTKYGLAKIPHAGNNPPHNGKGEDQQDSDKHHSEGVPLNHCQGVTNQQHRNLPDVTKTTSETQNHLEQTTMGSQSHDQVPRWAADTNDSTDRTRPLSLSLGLHSKDHWLALASQKPEEKRRNLFPRGDISTRPSQSFQESTLPSFTFDTSGTQVLAYETSNKVEDIRNATAFRNKSAEPRLSSQMRALCLYDRPPSTDIASEGVGLAVESFDEPGIESSLNCGSFHDALCVDDTSLHDKIVAIVETGIREFSFWRSRQGNSQHKNTATSRSEASGTGVDSSSSQSSQPSKRRRLDEGSRDEDEGDEESAGSSKQQGVDGNTDSDTRGTWLACPYLKHDMIKHRACLSLRLLEIKHVKQHLRRKHLQPHFCPSCGLTTASQTQLHAHIRARECQQQDFSNPEGLNEDQRIALDKRVSRKLSIERQWFTIWEIIFPGVAKPLSPYIEGVLEECLSTTRAFWQEHGETIIADLFQSGGETPYETPQEERILSTVNREALRLFIERAFETVFSGVINGGLSGARNGDDVSVSLSSNNEAIGEVSDDSGIAIPFEDVRDGPSNTVPTNNDAETMMPFEDAQTEPSDIVLAISNPNTNTHPQLGNGPFLNDDDGGFDSFWRFVTPEWASMGHMTLR
ncbi:hypothetical protein F5Y15DRAFT_373937 [Xylariaceae sp. FL0016]|nr:hypothetical protein F5Y15DRAFT_373937 [Xylariaceae sp. FL0016]